MKKICSNPECKKYTFNGHSFCVDCLSDAILNKLQYEIDIIKEECDNELSYIREEKPKTKIEHISHNYDKGYNQGKKSTLTRLSCFIDKIKKELER